MHQQNLLSVGQVAKLLGVCTKTIRRWCQSGKLRETLRTVASISLLSSDFYPRVPISVR